MDSLLLFMLSIHKLLCRILILTKAGNVQILENNYKVKLFFGLEYNFSCVLKNNFCVLKHQVEDNNSIIVYEDKIILLITKTICNV